MDKVNLVGTPIYVGPSPTIELRDCHWHDTYESRNGAAYSFEEAYVDADEWKFATEHPGGGVDIESTGTLRVDGKTRSSGTHSASDLSVADPRPFPSLGFDYSTRDYNG